MRRARSAVLLSAVAAVCLAGSVLAAGPTSLAFSDPAGDNISPSAASDITGVSFTTSGSGKGKSYRPKSLVVTLKLGAPPTSDGTTVYAIDTTLVGCGAFYLNYMPGATVLDNFAHAECGSTSPTDTTGSFVAVPEVKGSSLVWTIPMRSLPVKVGPGSVFTEIRGYTDFVDPALSIFGPASITGVPLYDTAETDKSYTVG